MKTGFTLKTHEMFSVRTTLEEQSPVILDLCLSEKAVLLDSSGLKSVFEKLGFRDGLMRVEDSTNLRNKAVYSNIFGVVWTLRNSILMTEECKLS